MSITFVDLFLMILNRNGALPLFLALAIISLLAAIHISKAPKLPHLATVLAVAILVCSLAAGVAMAPSKIWRETLRGVMHRRPTRRFGFDRLTFRLTKHSRVQLAAEAYA